MRYPALPAALLALVLTGAAPATRGETEAPKLPTLELSAEGSAEAANDLAVAQAYFEASDSAPGVLAAEVNRVIAEALKCIQVLRGVPSWERS